MSTLRQYLRSIRLLRERIPAWDEFPFCIPSLSSLDELELHPQVTFFVGENGSGKSTLLEAIAVLAGFSATGGAKYFPRGETGHSLHAYLRLVRGARREQDGFFLRAETYYNTGSFIDAVADTEGYGGRVHEKSHGEAFLDLIRHRFRGRGVYLLDEPEAALSPARQLVFLAQLHELVTAGESQLIIATHSPIIMAYPNARILVFGSEGISPRPYQDTEHYQVTSDFLKNPDRFLRHLLAPSERE